MNKSTDVIIERLKNSELYPDIKETLKLIENSNISILDIFVSHVISTTDAGHCTAVISGEFGRILLNNKGKELYNHFKNVVLIDGKIKNQTVIKYLSDKDISGTVVVLDDYIKSGITINKIESTINKLYPSGISQPFRIKKGFFIFSKYNKDNYVINSLFKI